MSATFMKNPLQHLDEVLPAQIGIPYGEGFTEPL